MSQVEADRLIDRVLDGDLEAYGDLVARYQVEVWRIVTVILNDPAGEEDLVQEVFIRAYQRLHCYERGRDFGVWLKAIARNLARNERRRRTRERGRWQSYYEVLGREPDGAAGPGAEPFRLDAALGHCLKRLPAAAAEAVRLRYEEALEFPELARRLQRTVPAVRQLLSRARLWLRDCVDHAGRER